MSNDITCRFASLNTRSLGESKANDVAIALNPGSKDTKKGRTQSYYLHFLNTYKQYDIMCFQEPRADGQLVKDKLDRYFRPKSSFWTYHLGIVSLSSSFKIEIFNENASKSRKNDEGAFQLCRVDHPQKLYETFYILNVYAPSFNSKKERIKFFDELTKVLKDADNINLNRLIICGDFNYCLLLPQRELLKETSSKWLELLNSHFYNTMKFNDQTDTPTHAITFGENSKESPSAAKTLSIRYSTIDYIYVGLNQLRSVLKDANITRVSRWSDHSMLDITLAVGQSPFKELDWWPNPAYLKHLGVYEKIEDKVSRQLAPAKDWDKIKSLAIKDLDIYEDKGCLEYKETIKLLNRDFVRILAGSESIDRKAELIEKVEKSLQNSQAAYVLARRKQTAAHGDVKRERDAEFLEIMYQRRSRKLYITPIDDETKPPHIKGVNLLFDLPENLLSHPELMPELLQQFYDQNYILDHVEKIKEIDQCLMPLLKFAEFPIVSDTVVTGPITIEEILEQLETCQQNEPRPGYDGVDYLFLKVLFNMPNIKSLILEVYNDALTTSKVPYFWKDTIIKLTPKEDAVEFSQLNNWQQSTLVNCDAVIFTKIISSRIQLLKSHIELSIQKYEGYNLTQCIIKSISYLDNGCISLNKRDFFIKLHDYICYLWKSEEVVSESNNRREERFLSRLKHNNQLFSVESFIKILLSIIPPSFLSDMASFFPNSNWCDKDLRRPACIVLACYKAYDYFGVKLDFSTECEAAALLQLPLRYLFISYPETFFWKEGKNTEKSKFFFLAGRIKKYKKNLAHDFFIYDTTKCCLRMKSNKEIDETDKYPILFKQLSDILCGIREITSDDDDLQVSLHRFVPPYIIADGIQWYTVEEKKRKKKKRQKKIVK